MLGLLELNNTSIHVENGDTTRDSSSFSCGHPFNVRIAPGGQPRADVRPVIFNSQLDERRHDVKSYFARRWRCGNLSPFGTGCRTGALMNKGAVPSDDDRLSGKECVMLGAAAALSGKTSRLRDEETFPNGRTWTVTNVWSIKPIE
ncbi:hypothetical protein C8034_v008192 [Colletotrichum sidae]|uniref:Uncharacterized protein n=1 Tax=Colletotrichum sidae TaxID=1347389 RepID=A0A4R8TPB6_9PEZI|nr:hypothetical protein C8034_v008192 [Colletotrichum sidae]